jgi:uncharacterized membrane protein
VAASDVIVRIRVQGQAAFKASMDTAAGSVTKVDKASDKAATSTSKMGDASKGASGKLRSMAGAAKGFIAASAGIATVTKVAHDAVGNAVDLGEQMNKTAVVFRGPGAKSIAGWSKTSSKAIGVSRAEALEATGVLGNMLVPMGFARDRAAQMSQKMVQLGGDMASFNNASPDETLDALRAGLAGESEPLRRFGVFLNDARLKQEAMSQGLYKGKGPLSASAKAAATYAVILKDTKDAQGDFARTSDSLANQQRIMKAEYANITATIGQKLLPVLSFLVKNLKDVAIVVGALVISWGIWSATSALAAAGTLSLSGAFGALSAAMLANPIGLALIAIVALVAGLVIAYRKVDWFRAAVDAAFKWIKTAAINVFGWIKSHWPLLVSILGGPFGIVAVMVIRNFDKIKSAASSVYSHVRSIFGRIKGIIGTVFSTDFVSGIGRGIADWLNAHTPFGDEIDLGFKKFTLPALADGGVVTRGGGALVGERGPELVSLPTGAQVTPLPAIALGGAGVGASQTTAHFYLDRRLIATAVAVDTADRQARR